MSDRRYEALARLIVSHSCRVQPGEKVLVESFDIPEDFTALLIREIAAQGGEPLCHTRQNRVLRELYNAATPGQMELWGAVERQLMEGVGAYVGLRGTHNATELTDVAHDRMELYMEHIWENVHTKVRVPKTKWVVLRWPTSSMAQQAEMSTSSFEDFFFDVCTVDYAAMAESMSPLQKLMDRARDVRIVGPGTDLRFSIEGIPVVGCAGEHNIPDGEMFTCPVRDSVEGTLAVNTRSLYQGFVFDDVRLTFEKGKIVEATANSTERIQRLLDVDEGARYIGEFSFGFNPQIFHPMMDILFDEKIAGSFHFTPGQAYEEADNGNRSRVHWDLVTIQRPDYGGGEVWFDGELVRKDGQFVPAELHGLNWDPARLESD